MQLPLALGRLQGEQHGSGDGASGVPPKTGWWWMDALLRDSNAWRRDAQAMRKHSVSIEKVRALALACHV